MRPQTCSLTEHALHKHVLCCRPVLITDVIPKWPAAKWTGHYYARKYGKEKATMKAVDVSFFTCSNELCKKIASCIISVATDGCRQPC